ncbi:MAG: hypothetical protein KF900_02325 [Bacteroidetes bacterium]|nr:hypothetical protein [Bacteroidota bacterium]
MFSKIIFNSPWYFVVLSILLGAAISFWLYFKNKKNSEAPISILRALLLLRFVSVTLIAFLLLNILLKQIKNETQNPLVIVAIDNSSSMTAAADSNFIKHALQEKLNTLKKNAGEKFTFKTVLFGNKTNSTDEAPDFSEKETDMDNLIHDLDNNFSNQNVGALILISDGIYNKGANPLYASEKLGYPIFSIAVGDTNEIKDVLIQKINHNQIAYSGNDFPVEIIVNAKKFQGKEVEVKLFDGNLEKAKQNLKINHENFLSTCNFTLNAEKAGIVKYTAKVTVLEGEKNVSNNVQSFAMEVIDNREKILLLANAPHPDIFAIKEAITNNTSYDFEFTFSQDFQKPLKAYSLVILHGFSQNEFQFLNLCKNENIPVWIVNPNTTENLPAVKISNSGNRSNDSEPFINTTFGLFNISNELKSFMKDLPAVKTFFGNYAVSNGANNLINQRIGTVETENPILTFSDMNGLKTALFLGDGLWKWKLRDFAEHQNHNLFNELISKTVQYLSVKSDKSFFRIVAPKIINENENVELNAQVYNKSYESLTEPDVTLVLSNSENKKFNYTFSKTSNAYKLNLGILPAGEYKYEAQVKVNNELFLKQGIIVVKEVIAEKINTVANHNLLYQLSNRSGGKLFYPNEFDKLENEILQSEQIKPITYSQTSTSPLIELKWLFGLIILLLATEWFFRKRFLGI